MSSKQGRNVSFDVAHELETGVELLEIYMQSDEELLLNAYESIESDIVLSHIPRST